MVTPENRSADAARTGLWRSRWAAIGAAVAVSFGAGGMLVAQAAPGPAESTIVSVTPERILDTRDPNNLGLAGPFVSPVGQKLQVTGSIPTATGTKTVVPAGATGVLLNVTSVSSTASGFISIRPGDATGAPSTSSLNVTAGITVPNSVQVAMPTAGANAGKIDITWDAFSVAGPTTDILIDVVGYTTNTGLQELVADVALKATTADVNAALATKASQVDLPTVAYAGGNQLVTVSIAQVLRTVTLTPPSDGTVIAVSNANTGPTLAGRGTTCSITTGVTVDSDFNQIVRDDGSNGVDMLTGLRGFDVTGGVPITVNLVCLAQTLPVIMFDSNLAATFYATDGVVTTTGSSAADSSVVDGQ